MREPHSGGALLLGVATLWMEPCSWGQLHLMEGSQLWGMGELCSLRGSPALERKVPHGLEKSHYLDPTSRSCVGREPYLDLGEVVILTSIKPKVG